MTALGEASKLLSRKAAQLPFNMHDVFETRHLHADAQC